jgi:serine/threonine-protein kinase
MTADTLFADRYRLERRLGVGGMATVQLALDTRLERRVAVKLLAEHLASDSNFVSRFRREALAAARLVHPNIVQVFDFGSEEATGRQYIVMEFVDGSSCAEILRELGRLEPGDAVSILTQACRGLDYAHRNGVVHRDVKPGNLLRSRDGGQVKLADFGIAKAAEHSDMTKVGSVLGTAAYLSPEQARGEPAGPASDLYALGVVSYQLLAGRLPFEAASLTDLARQQDTTAPDPLHELDPQIPRPLSLVVARSLERNPADRFADAAAMEQALEDSMRGIAPEPTAATRALDDTEATRMLERTAVTTPLSRTQPAQRRRGMEPIAEPPRPAPARRPAPAAAAQRARKRRPGGFLRALRTLLILALLAAIGVGAYVLLDQTGQRGVQLREQVEGNVDQAVDEIQGLIEDNTR